MKKILFTIFLFTSLGIFAQNMSIEGIDKELEQLLKKIKTLEEKNAKLNSEVGVLKAELSDFGAKTDSLKNQTQVNSDVINQVAEELGLKATEKTTAQKISELDNSLGKTTLWAIIGILLAIIISGIVYWLLRKKQESDKADMIEQLNEMKFSIEAKLNKTESSIRTDLNKTESAIRADVTEQLNKTESSVRTDMTEQLKKTESSIRTDLTEQLNKTESAIRTDVTEQSKKAESSIKKDVTEQLNKAESSIKADVTEQLKKAESSIKADVMEQLNKKKSS